MEKTAGAKGVSNGADQSWMFIIFAWVVLLTLIPSGLVMTLYPHNREQQLQELTLNSIYLNSPEKTFRNAYEDRKRDVVFVRNGQNWIYSMKEKQKGQPAVFYMAEVEAKAGRQPWLDEAYKSYTMTDKELKRLVELEKQVDGEHSDSAQPTPAAAVILEQRKIAAMK